MNDWRIVVALVALGAAVVVGVFRDTIVNWWTRRKNAPELHSDVVETSPPTVHNRDACLDKLSDLEVMVFKAEDVTDKQLILEHIAAIRKELFDLEVPTT